MKRFFISFVAFVIFSFLAVCGFAVSEEAKKHYDAAKTLYVAGDTEGAKKELEKALEIDPNYEAAKKLYEKLGGGTSKTTSVQTVASPQVTQPQVAMVPSSGGMSRDILKNSLLSVLSNSIDQSRYEIYVIMSDVIKESFDEIFRSDYRKQIRSDLKKVVSDIIRNIIEEEFSYSVSTVKGEEVKISVSNTNVYIPTGNVNESSKSSDNKAKAMELYNKAMSLLDDENYSAARELLIQASQLDPDNPKIKEALERLPK